jgi:hypothetical protein
VLIPPGLYGFKLLSVHEETLELRLSYPIKFLLYGDMLDRDVPCGTVPRVLRDKSSSFILTFYMFKGSPPLLLLFD